MKELKVKLEMKVKDCYNTNTIFDKRKYVLLSDAKKAIDEALSIANVIQQSEPLKCDQVCDWERVGHQLNGHQECLTCGKQKAF
jgi:hypothetical protein